MLRVCLGLGALVLLSATTSRADFVEVAADVGLDTPDDKGGLVWADFDGDGFLDVLVHTNVGSRLYLNDGSLPDPSFADVTDTHAPGLSTPVVRSAIAADIDHDGWVDFIRNSFSPFEVWLNRGPESSPPFAFGDDAGQPSLVLDDTTVPFIVNLEGIGWLDVDDDGWLDVVMERDGHPTVLLNAADGTGALTAPLVNPFGAGSGGSADYLTVADFDVDGDVDLCIRSDESPSLWLNDGAGSFEVHGGFDFSAPNSNKGGVAFCDFDDDGDMDIFYGDGGIDRLGGGPADRIYVREPDGTFTASSQPQVPAGLDVDGVACGDVDNDGDLDLFLTTGIDDLLFLNESTALGVRFVQDNLGITGSGQGEAASFADYDRDGDLDLLVNQNGGNELWRNELSGDGYLMVRVLADIGTCEAPVRRDDIGATVRLFLGTGSPATGVRELNGGKGHGSQGAPLVHFGLPFGVDLEYVLEVRFQHGDEPPARLRVVPGEMEGYRVLEVLATDPDGDGIPTDQELADAEALGPDGEAYDLDGDGFPNWHDADADDDGTPDALEAGDDDPCTPPVDSDGDGVPEYLVEATLEAHGSGLLCHAASGTPGRGSALALALVLWLASRRLRRRSVSSAAAR